MPGSGIVISRKGLMPICIKVPLVMRQSVEWVRLNDSMIVIRDQHTGKELMIQVTGDGLSGQEIVIAAPQNQHIEDYGYFFRQTSQGLILLYDQKIIGKLPICGGKAVLDLTAFFKFSKAVNNKNPGLETFFKSAGRGQSQRVKRKASNSNGKREPAKVRREISFSVFYGLFESFHSPSMFSFVFGCLAGVGILVFYKRKWIIKTFSTLIREKSKSRVKIVRRLFLKAFDEFDSSLRPVWFYNGHPAKTKWQRFWLAVGIVGFIWAPMLGTFPFVGWLIFKGNYFGLSIGVLLTIGSIFFCRKQTSLFKPMFVAISSVISRSTLSGFKIVPDN